MIVATEIESEVNSGPGQRMIYYRCQDSQGAWHRYGPVITADPGFDAEAFKSVVAEQVGSSLAESEFEGLLR